MIAAAASITIASSANGATSPPGTSTTSTSVVIPAPGQNVQATPPPQQVTTGTALPQTTVLANALATVPTGVTQSAIKTVSYGTIESGLGTVGLGGSGNIDSSWTPVPTSDPVDVVAVGGSVRPPGAIKNYSWAVIILNPVTGQVIATSASSNGGAWPPFFDALADQG
jgi:hypothetical protein